MLAHQRLLLSLNVPIFLKCPNPILMTLLKCILVPILSFAPPLTHVLCLMHTLLLSLTQLIVPFWIIDSGATDHITCSFNDFLSFSKYNLCVSTYPIVLSLLLIFQELSSYRHTSLYMMFFMFQILNSILFQSPSFCLH